MEQTKVPAKPKETSISAQVLLKAGRGTGAGRECALSIVPVQVKVIKGSRLVSTYAFLDPGSSGTFCTEELRRQLNAEGCKTEILLGMMGQKKTVTSYELSSLEVGNLDGYVFITTTGILSVVSSVYDPLGFLAPFTLKAKQIPQQLCKAKCGWDDLIPEVYVTAWQKWVSDVEQLSEF